MINTDNLSNEILDFISEKKIRKRIYHHDDYKKLCYNLFIPYKRYLTIDVETNGAVDDCHTSHLGHRQLTKDLISNSKL